MKNKILLMSIICVLLLSSFGCLKKKPKTDNDNPTTTTTTTRVVEKEEKKYWVETYDWSLTQDNDKSPMFEDLVSMPVNLKEFLSKYEVAIVHGRGNERTKPIDMLQSSEKDVSTISLYKEDPTGKQIPRDLSINIADDFIDNYTLSDNLKNGNWYVQGAFKLPKLEVEHNYFYYDEQSEKMRLFVEEYGKPSYISSELGLAIEVLWDCGEDAFGLFLQDSPGSWFQITAKYYGKGYKNKLIEDGKLISFDDYLAKVK